MSIFSPSIFLRFWVLTLFISFASLFFLSLIIYLTVSEIILLFPGALLNFIFWITFSISTSRVVSISCYLMLLSFFLYASKCSFYLSVILSVAYYVAFFYLLYLSCCIFFIPELFYQDKIVFGHLYIRDFARLWQLFKKC